MAENKIKPNAEFVKANEPRIKPAQNKKSASVFSGLEKRLKLESYFEEGFPVQYLPKVLFVVFL
ncbi:MAG: hypothetical protein ACKO96_36105, partial [Flammeovirgaceae bacterium]